MVIMRRSGAVLCCVLWHIVLVSGLSSETCTDSGTSAVIEPGAQAIIASVQGLRMSGEDGGCGAVDSYGVEVVEAIRWALQRINQDSGVINGQPISQSYIPGVKIGTVFADTCGSPDAVSKLASDFLPSSYSLPSSCSTNTGSIFLGFLGENFSSLTTVLARFAGKYGVPTVSFSATATSLADTGMYPTFMRTVPQDSAQAQVMISLVRKLGWQRFLVLYADDKYGEEGFKAIVQAADNADDLCVIKGTKVANSDISQPNKMAAYARELVASGVSGVLVFSSLPLAKSLLSAASTVSKAGQLQWIFSEAIGTDPPSLDNIQYFKGSLVVSLASRSIAEFEDHWVRIDENNPSSENPWFKEWYMDKHRCRLQGVTASAYATLPSCPSLTETQKRQQYKQGPYTEPAILAVYAYAKALKTCHTRLCGGAVGLCDALKNLQHEAFYNDCLLPLDMTFTRDERVSTLASNNIAPWNSAKRLSFGATGEIADPAYDVWNYKNTGAGFKFVKVASYNGGQLSYNSEQITFYDESRSQPLASVAMSPCPVTGCTGCYSPAQSATASQAAYTPGDILIGALFPLHMAGPSGLSCGDLDPRNMQLVESFLYALNAVKQKAILSGVTLGGIAFDTCSNALLAQNRIATFHSATDKFQIGDNVEISSASLTAYVGGDNLDSAISESSILHAYNLPLIGYGTKASSLSTMNKFPLFARTMINEDSEIQLVIYILRELGVSFVQQVYSAEGESVAMQFKQHAARAGICVASSIPLTDTVADTLVEKREAQFVITWMHNDDTLNQLIQHIMKSPAAYDHFTLIGSSGWGGGLDTTDSRANGVLQGSIFWVYENPILSAYEAHLAAIDASVQYSSNPWFSPWYEKTFQCYIDGSNKRGYSQQCQQSSITDAPDYKINNDVVFVINAVYTAAHALHKSLQYFCGEQYNGVCSEYEMATNKSQVFINFVRTTTFEDDSEIAVAMIQGSGVWPLHVYSVMDLQYNYVGAYANDVFSINAANIGRREGDVQTCPGTCPICNYVALSSEYIFQDGDFLIGALFDIHKSGPSPFSCGAVRLDRSYQYSEAFLYAIQQVNSGKAPVNLSGGLTLGGLGVDVCSSSLRAAALVSDVHQGVYTIDELLQPEKIISWLSRNTAESLEVADVTKGLLLPQVGMTATSGRLQDPHRSPSFFYTLTSDDVLADAMVRVAQHMEWYYIQIVTLANVWGRSSRDALTKASEEQGVCVLNQIEIMSDMNEEGYDDIVRSLIAAPTDVVLLFVEIGEVRELLKAKQRIGVEASRLTFITSELYGDLDDVTPAPIGLITFKINSPVVDDFDEYMKDKYPVLYTDNPWFDDYYEALWECDMPGRGGKFMTQCQNPRSTPITAAPNYQQEFLLINTINAVYLITAALDKTLRIYCGDGYTGMCEDFKNEPRQNIYKTMMTHMESLNFTDASGADFRLQNRQYDQGYKVYAYSQDGSYIEVGSFAKTTGLIMHGSGPRNFYSSIRVDCGSRCAHCQMVEQRVEKFTYIPGDILLGGIFDVHQSGGSPFTCGELNTRKGFQLLEAFNYAIQYVNNNDGMFSGKLNGITLGGVALDACSSPTRAGNLVANVHSGFLPLERNGDQVDPERIKAYIGPYYSDASVQVADVLSKLTIPQISYGSTSIVLKDRELYPYFLRTVPADDKQAQAIVALLKKLKLTYVQVVYSPGTYGEQAVREFIAQATSRGICVAQSTSLITDEDSTQVSMERAMRAVDSMLSKPNARAVVTFINTQHITPFLQAINATTQAKQRFLFIGSEAWADYQDIVNGLGDVVQNSITLGVETSDLTDFDKYLEPKTPSNSSSNPWFNEYYESVFRCSLSGSSRQYPEVCSPVVKSIVRAKGYVQDPYVIYTTNAVFAAAQAIHKTLQSLCGDNYRGMCPQFRTATDTSQLIFEEMKKVHFVDESEQLFEFTNEQESNRGYHIYSIRQSAAGQMDYQNIGSFNTTHLLRIASSFRLEFESNCDAADSCGECSPVVHESTRVMERTTRGAPIIAAFFNVHNANIDNPFKCGKLDHTGFQQALAFFYALDQVNNEELNLPNYIKMGGLGIDVCGNSLSASRDLYSLMSGGGLCYGSSISDVLLYHVHTNSGDARTFQEALSPLHVVSMSAVATSPQLSNKAYFLRTVPSDALGADVMAQLARQMEWRYVSAIISDDTFWSDNAQAFVSAAKTGGDVCIGSFPVMPADATLDDAKDLVKELYRIMGDSVVYLFTSTGDTKLILQASQDLQLHNKLTFVGGESFGSNSDIFTGLEAAAQGSISVWLETPGVYGFMEWLSKLTVADHGDIPDDWFEEFWQDVLQCRLENATVVATQYTRVCLRTDRLEGKVDEADYLLPIIISVQVVAYGLANIEDCGSSSAASLSSCLAQLEANKVYESIARAQWTAPRGLLTPGPTLNFNFTPQGNGNLQYAILNFQRLEANTYSYVNIGSYSSELTLDKVAYRDVDNNNKLVPSVCPSSKVCKCISGTGINGSDTGGHKNGGGGNGGGGGGPQTGARTDLKENFAETWKIVLAVLAGLGILVTVLMAVYLLIFYPVKGGTSAVGYLLLFTVLLIYLLTFAFIVLPSVEDCAIRRFCLGVVFALAFACMLVKVLNTWRIGDSFDEYSLPQYKRLSHPCSLFFIALGITMVQVIIGIEWLVLRPPAIDMLDDGRVWKVCSEASFHYPELVISCIYVMFLILLTFIFSIVTWDSEENHRESRWICITTCFSIAIWIVWTVIATLTAQRYRDPAIAIACVANATVILLCIFVRKLWLLRRYEKEIDDEKSRMSTLSRNTATSKHDNGIHTNPMYLYVDSASISGNSNIVYHAPRSPGTPDVVY